MYVCMYRYVCVYVCMYICTCVCMYLYMYTYVCVCHMCENVRSNIASDVNIQPPV